MVYKKLFLSLLLAPGVLYCNADIEQQLQQLEETLFQKHIELSRLGDMIAEKDGQLEEVAQGLSGLIDRELKKSVGRAYSRSLSDKERKALKKEIVNSADEFVLNFFTIGEKQQSIKGMLIAGLLQQNEKKDVKEFDSLKFYLIRATFEHELIQILIEKYEACAQQLFDIIAKIEYLKKSKIYN